MRRTITASLFALMLSPAATAAEVTDMPPALRADISVDYRGAFLFGSIEEDQWGYGRRRIARHDVTYGLEFAVVDGIALNVAVDTTPWLTYQFPLEPDLLCAEGYGCDGPTGMQYDPVQDTGTYVDGEPLPHDQVPSYEGSGINGVWIGTAFAPFSEAFQRKHRVTWRLDAAFRTPNKSATFWNLREDGSRGAAPGGSALKLGAAFSTDNGVANPYLAGAYQYESAFRIDEYRDHAGQVWGAGDMKVQPASRIDARAGVELIAWRNDTTGGRFAFDLFMGFGYRSAAQVPSGLLLPDVLDVTKGTAVTEEEHVVGFGGIGLDHHMNKYAVWRVGLDARYFTPHHLEHLYPARSDYDTLEFTLTSNVEIRIR